MTDTSSILDSTELDRDAADGGQFAAAPSESGTDVSPVGPGVKRPQRRLGLRGWRRRRELDRADQPEGVGAETERLNADGETGELQDDTTGGTAAPTKPQSRISGTVVYVLLPLVAMALAGGVAFLKYQTSDDRMSSRASTESVQAAKVATVRMLSYSTATVEKDLGGASELLTGAFRDSYTALIRDVVIPGAKEQQITATATVPAAASISASPDHAVVLVYVNHHVSVGNDAPTQNNSVVQVSLDRSDDKWLVSSFDPK